MCENKYIFICVYCWQVKVETSGNSIKGRQELNGLVETGLRVEYHSAHAKKNSGLLTQELLAASNGELYTAM